VIIRILGDGQYDLQDDQLVQLNAHDDQLAKAIGQGDEAGCAAALSALVEAVQRLGRPVPAEPVVRSKLILPSPASPLSEVRDLVSDDGLIPG
jgi:hypothetical protein